MSMRPESASASVALARVGADATDRERPETRQRVLTLDAGAFNRHFERRPFLVDHALAAHPLFRMPRLVELATTLPAEQVEYNAGTVPVSLDPKLTPRNGLSAEETIRRIEECDSWLVLKNVERDHEYRALMERCLSEVGRHVQTIAPGLHLGEAFVFVSSPHSVTPFHIDPEHNFLFQIRGHKTLYAFDAADREVLPERDLESFCAGAHRNLPFQDTWHARATACRLAPGQGLHVPVTAPHWVQNGAAVSVSFSVTFRSELSIRLADVYAMNHHLRRAGLAPTPPGQSPYRDLVKQFGMRAWRRSRRVLSRLTLRQDG